MKENFHIDPDIRKAETLPASFYQDPSVFESIRQEVFAKSWQWIGDSDLLLRPESVHPFVLLEGFMKEPMVLTTNKDLDPKCLSNVCTHRANIVVEHSGKMKSLICGYHGRRFAMDGTFISMPEFKEAENFPRPCDSLHQFPLNKWNQFLFTSIDPCISFEEIVSVLNERVGFLPIEDFKYNAELSKDYLVHAHWALYCDNYLEGFHIPFVHSDLNEVLDYGSYTTLLYDHLNLQIGFASDGEEAFNLPEGHIDYGKHVAAYYFWVFPNMMFNFYPWGLSVNIVKPIDINRTKVSFLTYVYDESKMDSGAGALLDKVEREDEFVVESVHRGLKSKFYQRGRFSPSRETGVHHFHRLLASFVG